MNDATGLQVIHTTTYLSTPIQLNLKGSTRINKELREIERQGDRGGGVEGRRGEGAEEEG